MNDWTCPYCGKIAFNGENKLRHLSKHEPCIRRLIRADFRKMIMLIMNIHFEEVNNVTKD